jgi:hypothetical protein
MAITAHCEAAVIGKRFVKISDPKQAGSTLTPSGADTVTGGNIVISQAAAAGDAIFGVADKDGAIGGKVGVLRAGHVVPMTAGGAITAGTTKYVTSDADGKAVAAADSGAALTRAGIPLTSTTADGQEVLVALIDAALDAIA